MFIPERKSPPAAPSPAAAPAAGIGSSPLVPAAPFPSSDAARQHAIGPRQCRWILADEDRGAEALMCGAPAERRRPFCAAHCAIAYLKPPAAEDDDLKPPEEPPDVEEAEEQEQEQEEQKQEAGT